MFWFLDVPQHSTQKICLATAIEPGTGMMGSLRSLLALPVLPPPPVTWASSHLGQEGHCFPGV